MDPIRPILTAHLFTPLSDSLLELLEALTPADWQAATACEGWTVRDVVAHLLGGSLGRLEHSHYVDTLTLEPILSRYRQLAPPDGPFADSAALTDWINAHNAAWQALAASLTPAALVGWLHLSEPLLAEHFAALDPAETAPIAVAWAGETSSANWFDTAREYSEKWHHQQHIRDAVGRPGTTDKTMMYPVLDTFLRALPYTFRRQAAPDGLIVQVSIVGDAGGDWSLRRDGSTWTLFSGRSLHAVPTSIVAFEQDLAWRLFTKGIAPDDAYAKMRFIGPRYFAEPILQMTSIMA